MKSSCLSALWVNINSRKRIVRKVFVVIFFFAFSALEFHSLSYANPSCSTCLNETEQGEKIMQCSNGHYTHHECLNEQVKNIEDVSRIKTGGFRCNGLDVNGCQCKKSFSLDQIRSILEPTQKEELDKRLIAVAEISDKSIFDQEVRRLSQGINEAFVLCCPTEGCGGSLDKIEGCNAAKCSNSDCNTIFCYLCLERQVASQAAHTHVKDHSGDYWEQRPGYSERYHWLIARNELGFLFKRKIDSAVMKAVLDSQKPMLEERNMWPFPAGKMTDQWLQVVRANEQLSLQKKIELLQNEAIYKRKVKDAQSTILVEAEIRRLGDKILASLDIRDAQGVDHQVDRPAIAQVQVAPVVGDQPHLAGDIIPVMENDPRVSHDFSLLGNMYQVNGLIWSGGGKDMSAREAGLFCSQIGARLPTAYEWENLARAMGKGTARGYNSNLLSDFRSKFWSSTQHPTDQRHGFYFDGSYGYLLFGEYHCVRVRCVINVQLVR